MLTSKIDAQLFFHEIVEPTVAEFMAARSDKRRGCLACLVLASMMEHYSHEFASDTEQARKEMKLAFCNENKALRWISDVADATRHVVRHPRFKAISFNDIQTMEMGQCGVMRCGWPIRGEEVLVGPKHEWRLSDLLECATDFWRQRLTTVTSDQ